MTLKTTSSVSGSRTASPAVCFIFGLIFLLAGVTAFYISFVQPLQKVQSAQSWTPANATITDSYVVSETSGKSSSRNHKVGVQYSFQFNGRKYSGSQYSFMPGSKNHSSQQAIVSQLAPGTSTTCYVNPANPNQSVLNRSITTGLFSGMFVSLICVAAGLGIIALGFKTKSNNAHKASGGVLSVGGTTVGRPDLATPGMAVPPVAPFPANDFKSQMGGALAQTIMQQSVMPAPSSGPVTLKPREPRVFIFYVLLFFGLFWNAIIGTFAIAFLVGVFKSGLDTPSIFLGLFLTPFVLVGLGLIGGTIHQFLIMTGPKVELTVSQAAVPFGETLRIRWKLIGKKKLTKFQIFLEGREEAIYRSDTNSVTDKNTFCVLNVTDAMSSALEGDAKVQIPTNTMHSFEARNNKIIWQLVVKGEIPIWPDIKEEYPIAVVPRITS